MKFKLSALFSTLALSAAVFAEQPAIPKSVLSRFDWRSVDFSQKITARPQGTLADLKGMTGYKIPADRGTIKIKITSRVADNKTVFVPNVMILDSQFNPSLNYPSSQFKFEEARGINEPRYEAELSLTPTDRQEFIYLLVYTTAEDLKGETTVTHPAKMLAKAKGNQPPSIADIVVKHSESGEIRLEVDGVQTTQFIGLGGNGALFETKATESQKTIDAKAIRSAKKEQVSSQPVEPATEQYFNRSVSDALKNNDINKAMNLVNEAEKLGLTSPRNIFLQQVSSK